MKIGVCEKDLPGGLDENLQFLADKGFQGLQIWPDRVENAQKLMQRCLELNLSVSSVGGGPNLVKKEEKGIVFDAFRMRFDMAAELGCFIVTAETKEKPSEMQDDDAWKSCAETVRKICEYAEKQGGVLAIEPSGTCFVKDTDDWLKLYGMVNSKGLKVNYDPANIVWAGKDPVEGVKKTGRHIVHTHAKNIIFESGEAGYREGSSNLAVRDVPANKGTVNYKLYLKALKTAGYRGFLTIEMHCLKGEDRRRDILESKNFLEKLVTEAKC